jgi:Caspase domain
MNFLTQTTLARALFRAIPSVALLSALAFHSNAQAPNDVRIALIIGNSAYAGNMALANPANDAKDMSAALRNMGFGVIEIKDASREQMMAGIARANKELSGKQGVGMLFYAGHGLQLDWHNYMVPVDAKLNSAKDVAANTVDIEVVMKSFQQAGNRMNIVVLDACRDDPFANGKTSSGKGLAPLDAPTGTFLAYATAPGNVAQDGSGKNGLYTGFLLKELQKPTAKIEEVFKRVRFAVRKESNGAQVPWETTSLEDDFIFNSGIKKTVKLSDEEKTKQYDIEKADWDKIKESKEVNDYYAFVQKYPKGFLLQSAMGVIDRLSAAKLATYTDRSGIEHTATKTRYRVGDQIERVRRDAVTNQEINKHTLRVVSVAGGIVSLAGGAVLTTLGEDVYNPGTGDSYDPPRPFLPADDMAIGKKWSARVTITLKNGDKNWEEVEGRIVAVETITIPAGTFKTYKIEQSGNNGWNTRVKSTYWILPNSGFSLKSIVDIQRGNGKRESWVQEATSIKLAVK